MFLPRVFETVVCLICTKKPDSHASCGELSKKKIISGVSVWLFTQYLAWKIHLGHDKMYNHMCPSVIKCNLCFHTSQFPNGTGHLPRSHLLLKKKKSIYLSVNFHRLSSFTPINDPRICYKLENMVVISLPIIFTARQFLPCGGM